MKIYVRAYWYDNEDPMDDIFYGRDSMLDADSYEDDTGYNDFGDYDLYGYSEYEDFYNQIKKRKVYVPIRVARDIPDYNAYRKALFGTLYLSNQSGESIEALYDELCIDFPGILKSDLINDTDMLLEIVDVTLYAQGILRVQ